MAQPIIDSCTKDAISVSSYCTIFCTILNVYAYTDLSDL